MLDIVNRQHTNPGKRNKRKPMRWIVIDSLIVGGISFFAAWIEPIPSFETLCVMLKAFVGSFLIQLAIERGIKRE